MDVSLKWAVTANGEALSSSVDVSKDSGFLSLHYSGSDIDCERLNQPDPYGLMVQ